MTIPRATAHETDVRVLRDRCNYLKVDNDGLREQVADLERQVAALTQERDEYSNELKHGALPSLLQLQDQLVAAQAVNEKLREVLQAFCEKPINGFYLEQQCAIEALALTNDTTALQQRLAEERERCAKVCENTDQEYDPYTGAPKRLNYFCADAIRAL